MSRDIIDGKYKFNWLPTQRRVMEAVGSMAFSNILYCSGFGGGKSRCGGEIGLQLSIKYPGIEIGFWRKTRAALKDTTYRIFLEQVMPPEFIVRHDKADLTIIDQNLSRYDFLGMDRVTRKGSYFFDVVIAEEAIELEEPEIKMIEGRLRSRHIPRPFLLGLTNPGAPGGYWHKEYVEREKPDPQYGYFSCDSFENIHNPATYFERLKKWEGTQYYGRYVKAQWTAFAGNVWDAFDPKVHVVPPFEISREWKRIIAIDWGYDNPLVMLWMARDPLHNRWVVYRQFYKTHTLVRDAAKLGKKISEKTGEYISTIWADHEAESRAQFETDWRETCPANKEVSMGIQTVEESMFMQPDGKPGLLIFNNAWSEREGFWYGLIEQDPELKEKGLPTCLQEEIPKYKWGKNDAPIKEYDHACDGLRYGEHSEKEEYGTEKGIQVFTEPSFGRR